MVSQAPMPFAARNSVKQLSPLVAIQEREKAVCTERDPPAEECS